ncbi:MAG TPA: histidine kinase [Mycobacteriales bacterium]|jgi:signal transduction histidine kinase|nr:histidine kinase [Mycobacteriales bacterium]
MRIAGQNVMELNGKEPGAIRSFIWALWLTILMPFGLVLFILTTVFASMIWAWMFIPLVFVCVGLTRKYANLHRSWTTRVMGIETPRPYRPMPAGATWLVRLRVIATDPATWRDLAWLLVNYSLGFALRLTVLIMSVFLGWLVSPYLLRAHALLNFWLLAPARSTQLASRVEQLATSRADTVDAHATELRRVERDLHDGAQARLVALGMSLGLAEDAVDRDPESVRALLAEARETSGQALVELRDLVRGIHPPVLADRGLDGAIQALGLACPVPTEVEIDLPGRATAPVESAAYFAVSEALANVMKHSQADKAWVRVHYADGRLFILVGDDGVGGASIDRGSGIRGLERRLSAFDGTVFLSSPSGGPTVLSMDLPCELKVGKVTS